MNSINDADNVLKTEQLYQGQHAKRPHSIMSLTITSLMLAVAVNAFATDGYFSNGYGIKSKGRAGVSVTATDDAFGGANNPATVVWTDDRIDGGVDWFRPTRESARSGAAGPASALNGQVSSDQDNFIIPELALKYAINPALSVGVSVYGNGGMNTDYSDHTLNFGPGGYKNLLAGSGRLGVDFSQLFVAPTVAYKITPTQSVGLAPIIGYQWFKASGLSAFAPLSQDATALTDRDYDHAFGIGVRLGYLWNITPGFSVGAAYSSPVFMQRFDKYKGLFAKDGSFDTPQSFSAGLGWQVSPAVHAGLDYKWIDYAGIAAVGNSSSNPGQLGQAAGPGFGWRSISVIKLGTDWKVNDEFTLRGGYSYNENPIPSRDVTFNILAPGVIQHHLTAGATYAFGRQELSAAYMYGVHNSVSGESRFVALGQAPPGTSETISMHQNSFGLQYSYKF
ncbi:MAG: OmpP1/FadL family transporter [Desulfuromonadaceae bacterium]